MDIPLAPSITVSSEVIPKTWQRGRNRFTEADGFFDNLASWMKAPREHLSESIFPRQKVLQANRYWELDAIRGLSVGMMVAQHGIKAILGLVSRALMLAALGAWEVAKSWLMLALVSAFAVQAFFSERFPRVSKHISSPLGKGIVSASELILLVMLITWLSTNGSGAAAFMLLMGISMSISQARVKTSSSHNSLFPKFLKRGVLLLACASLMTFISFLISPQNVVTFGILHLLGTSTLLAYPFLLLPIAAALLGGLGVIGVGEWLNIHPRINNSAWLHWLGIPTAIIPASLDYFPLLPWFGVVLLGIVLGKVLYPDGEREARLPDFSDNKVTQALSWMGEKALPIFMLQEPLYFWGVMS